MKVKEMIAKLQQMPQDDEVVAEVTTLSDYAIWATCGVYDGGSKGPGVCIQCGPSPKPSMTNPNLPNPGEMSLD